MVNQLLTNKTRLSDYQITVRRPMGIKTNSVKILYALCANRVIQDAVTLKFSYIDIFDRVLKPETINPYYQSFSVAGRLSSVTKGKHVIEVKILNSDEVIANVLFSEREFVEGEVPFTAFFFVVPIKKTGKHFIKIFLDGKSLNRVFFEARASGSPYRESVKTVRFS